MTLPLPMDRIRRLISLIDLTSLNADDDETSVRALCAQAGGVGGPVAAVCVWPRLLPIAKADLAGTGVPVAVVTNFPDGEADPARAAAETAQAVGAGADEVDVVFPYRAFLAGDHELAARLVRACREACGATAILKVILETGQLGAPDIVERAAEIAVAEGAHFLKTSTGKTQPGATREAAAALIAVVARAAARGHAVGFKASGGVRQAADADLYLSLFEQTLGPGSAKPAVFRIGASSLLADLRAAL